MKKLSLVFIFGLLIGVFIVLKPAYAQGNEQESQQEPTTQTEEQVDEKTVEGTYNYVAQTDDTYTHIARKAIQTYGLETRTNLSGAQIIFAETNMTIESGSAQLNLGQKVEVSKQTIKNWVEKAQALSEAQEANWDYYVQFVDFNTDAVGEVR